LLWLFLYSLKICHMNLLQRLEFWGDRHHPKWADILRFALGIFLCYKGIEFLENMSSMINRMSGLLPSSYFALSLLGHYIVFAHLVGGLMLAFGLLTRAACILQIPILIGAIFFINREEMFRPFSQIIVTVLCLVGLIYFLIAGNGPWSVDKYFDEKERKAA
jgi:putative oxidoreductase